MADVNKENWQYHLVDSDIIKSMKHITIRIVKRK